MPLLKKSKKSTADSEMKEDGSKGRALAIAYSMKRKANKASGGTVESGDSEMNYGAGGKVESKIYGRGDESKQKGVHLTNHQGKGNSTAGSFVKGAAVGSTSIPKEKLNDYAKEEHERVLGEMKAMPNPNLKSRGGFVEKGVHQPEFSKTSTSLGGSSGRSLAGRQLLEAKEAHSKEGWAKRMEKAKGEHEGVLDELRSMPNPKLLAEGGEAEQGPIDKDTADTFAKGMCPSCGYSEGGMVANQDEPIADFMPNEFDDLHLRDELKFNYTGKNSGDEDGSDLNQEKSGLVDRIMKRRKRG